MYYSLHNLSLLRPWRLREYETNEFILPRCVSFHTERLCAEYIFPLTGGYLGACQEQTVMTYWYYAEINHVLVEPRRW
jgi:hypothetical protein